ncbi:hypothetical protein BC940DRAFT_368258 [Gongronella butleri]|nr:hypothetical protein BC940DRAFT_368258 [Gongronella butleri]
MAHRSYAELLNACKSTICGMDMQALRYSLGDNVPETHRIAMDAYELFGPTGTTQLAVLAALHGRSAIETRMDVEIECDGAVSGRLTLFTLIARNWVSAMYTTHDRTARPLTIEQILSAVPSIALRAIPKIIDLAGGVPVRLPTHRFHSSLPRSLQNHAAGYLPLMGKTRIAHIAWCLHSPFDPDHYQKQINRAHEFIEDQDICLQLILVEQSLQLTQSEKQAIFSDPRTKNLKLNPENTS